MVCWGIRLLSLISLFVLGLFFAGNLDGSLFSLTPSETILFFCFPIATVVGLTLAWWRELAGGGLVLAGLILFYILHWLIWGYVPKGPYFVLFSLPGILFFFHGLCRLRRQTQPDRTGDHSAPEASGTN